MPDGTKPIGAARAIPPKQAPAGPPVKAYTVGPVPPAFAREGAESWSLADSFVPLNNDRYVSVGSPAQLWVGGKRAPERLAFPILDLVSNKVTLPEVTPDPQAPGSPTLVRYDAVKGDAGLFTRTGNGATDYRYAHWDLATGTIDWTVPLGEINTHTLVQPIGVDPQGRYFYFLKETNATQELNQQNHADKATVARVNLATRQIDWQHEVPLPGRTGTVSGSLSVHPSADYSKFALTEYALSATGENGGPPPQGIVVDVATDAHATLTIPPTPYGVAFDRENRYLAIASNMDKTIYRYDLTTNKQDLVVGTVGRAHTLAVSADNAHLYVFGKGRVMEVRDWPSLASNKTVAAGKVIPGQTFLAGEGMAIMPDGKHAVISKTELPYGFLDGKGLYSVGL